MSDSSLISYKNLTENCNKPRNHVIDKITVHHMAGFMTAKECADYFASTERQVSSNYCIGSDGKIAMSVEEKNRSWCSSSPANDHRAITIEVANSTGAPDWKISEAAMKSLIELCADICRRNNIKKLNFTGDASGNLTMHKYFAATDCPGPYLSGKFKYIADEVNKMLTTVEYFKNGDKSNGVYAYKQMLILLKASGVILQNVDDNNIFGEGTEKATKQVQKAAGLEQDGFAGPLTVRACHTLLSKKIR